MKKTVLDVYNSIAERHSRFVIQLGSKDLTKKDRENIEIRDWELLQCMHLLEETEEVNPSSK